eukprot:PITA_24110
MPFRLINVGTTFQRAMDIAFRGLMNISVVVYMDDITMYSYHRRDHIYHLRQIFKRCRRSGISLNPKKSIFAVTEGKLLGHILSKEWIVIDPKRVQTIMRIQPPTNKKAMQSFFGRINVIRKFVSGFAEIVCPLQLMMRKYVVYKWSDEAKVAFRRIKEAIIEAPALAKTKVIVPHPDVRALFVQKEMGERRGNWITTLQEFDLEIKPT